MRFTWHHGDEISMLIEPLAALRIAVFREWPYLYKGSIDYERKYLDTYVQSPDSLLFGLWNDGKLVGATTCIPLHHETPEVQKTFVEAGMEVGKIFYFGESILLPKYRGAGFGYRFFDEREAHAASFGHYDTTCFCAVVRPDDHPGRPAHYRPLDAFWQKRGYVKSQDLRSTFQWLDIGKKAETAKEMVYWTRALPVSEAYRG
jgi:GNAT superfamily N-acetyltransferase